MSEVTRGYEDLGSFRCANTLNTTTSIDRLVVISASATVALFTFASANSVPVGTIREVTAASPSAAIATVSLFACTQRGIAGGNVSAGGRLVAQSTTGYIIDAAGTLTANPVIGIAVTSAASSGQKFEYLPLQYGSVVLA